LKPAALSRPFEPGIRPKGKKGKKFFLVPRDKKPYKFFSLCLFESAFQRQD